MIAIVILTAWQGGAIERLDPALDSIVPAGARVEQLAGGFNFTEGPVWVPGGYLLFTDNNVAVLHKWSPKDSVTTFLQGADLDRAGIGGSPGADGLTLDRSGRLYVADDSHRRIARLSGNGRLETVVDSYQGKRLNSPNDMVFKSDGSLYFTDPAYGLDSGYADSHRELDFAGVYRWKDGRLDLLTKELSHPNGIAFSPEERFLYVANSDEARKIWMRYPVLPDGSLGAGTVFFDASQAEGKGLPDGMKVDRRGNVYGTGPGGIWIISPAGEARGRIHVPETPANCAWGDANGKTLYITAVKGLYRIRLNVAGVRPGP
ncbi:MAG: SMP-30/gluconolactonase/LRE family protein [Gemmatimonadetes bacterium]|nr:SMP-30/gluconolactonase/LRE family protein [Gemmatimonadota bacterium]